MSMTADEMLAIRGLEKDLLMMEAYIAETEPAAVEGSHIPFKDYLMHWNEAKEEGNLFNLFGGNLIISKRVSFERSVEEIYQAEDSSKLSYLLYELASCLDDFIQPMLHINFNNDDNDLTFLKIADIYYSYRNRERISAAYPDRKDFLYCASFLINEIRRCKVWIANELTEEFFENYDEGDSRKGIVCTLADKKLVLQPGMKPCKAVKKLIEVATKYLEKENICGDFLLRCVNKALDKVLLESSMLLNQKKVSGILTLSIHPFDYMTMSDERNGWTSCMRWNKKDPGEYHAGTLEMMTSPCVVVAYLESKHKINPAGINYSWNKKKWRELFIVDKRFISGVKGYPYHSIPLEDKTFEMLANLAKKNWNISYDIANIKICKDYNFHNMIMTTNFMYNDWSNYECRILPASDLDIDTLPTYYAYGDRCYCLKCGDLRDCDEEVDELFTQYLCCEDCLHLKYCDICGSIISENDLIETEDGRLVCSSCFDENYEECQHCGKILYKYDMREFVLNLRLGPHHSISRIFLFRVCEEDIEKMTGLYCDCSCYYDGHIDSIDENGVAWIIEHCDIWSMYGEDTIIDAAWIGKEENHPAWIKEF